MRTASRKSSLKWLLPVIWRIGATVTPGESIRISA